MITVLKSKIPEAVVTKSSVDYKGSITIDVDIMNAMDIIPYERDDVNGLYVPRRIATYALAGEKGSGCIELNGGASQFFKIGDIINILAWKSIEEKGTAVYLHRPTIVHLDENNKLI